MNAQVKSQLLGLTLALTTAIGCIAYEKIVKNFSFSIICFLAAAFYAPLFTLLLFTGWSNVTSDLTRLAAHPSCRWWALLYFMTWVTTPLWFVITKNQSVLAGSIYEVKYIVILAVFYVFLGEKPVTMNTVTGICCALASIWFISKK